MTEYTDRELQDRADMERQDWIADGGEPYQTPSTVEILQQCHTDLWAFREHMGDSWPTPDTLDALRFAVTEAGEALDAWMRANRPQYARNRDRLNGEDAVLDELADCAMMLLTALGPGEFVGHFTENDLSDLRGTPVSICCGVASAAETVEQGNYFSDFSIEFELLYIATYPGMDLPTRLNQRYARIKAKNKPRLRLLEVDGQIGGIHYGSQNATAQDVADRHPEGWGTDTQ